MKNLVLFSFVFLFTFISPLARAELKLGHGVQIYYSESIDVFEIIENMAIGEFKDNDYHRYWVSNLTLESSEKSLLGKYKKLREKYYPDFLQKNDLPEIGNNLFSPALQLNPDSFAQAFYTSESVDEALQKLAKNVMTIDEVKFLAEVFRTLKPKISVMVKESAMFKGKMVELNKALGSDRPKKILRAAARFLAVNDRYPDDLPLFFVWWPSLSEPRIDLVGHMAILRFNPIHHTQNLTEAILIDKAIEAFLVKQGKNQKDNLSKQFLLACDPRNFLKAEDVLQNPLIAILGRMSYEEEKMQKDFDLTTDWKLGHWGNSYARLLYSIVRNMTKSNKETINGTFIPKAALLCQDLINIRKSK